MKLQALPILAVILFSQSSSAADSPVSPPLDSISQRVRACTPCHGSEDRITAEGYYPRIAGKPAGYLYNQLLNFREGRRPFPIMTYLTERQTDAYLREMAAYFATQNMPYPRAKKPAVDAGVLERGRMLVEQGDPQSGLPACNACHGKELMGVEPAVPGLLGLSEDYLGAQLEAWRSGVRRAHEPDCMAELVQRMSQQDLRAATAWLASRPVPESARPEPGFVTLPSMRCGNISDPDGMGE